MLYPQQARKPRKTLGEAGDGRNGLIVFGQADLIGNDASRVLDVEGREVPRLLDGQVGPHGVEGRGNQHHQPSTRILLCGRKEAVGDCSGFQC